MSLSLFMKEQTGDPQILYDAVDLRQLLDGVYQVAGVLNDASYKVTQRSGGANTSVDVAAGTAVLQGISVANQGKYQHEETSGQNFTMPSKPASGQSRIDIVCLRQYDHLNDHNANTSNPGPYDCPVVVVQGGATTDSGGNPTCTAPTVPPVGQVWAAYLPLASVLRRGAEVSIQTAVITDVRPRAITATHEIVIRATPQANHILGGPFGCTAVITVGPYSYDTVHDVRFGEVLGQSVVTDSTEAYLFVDNATQIRGGRGTGEWNTIFGTYISDTVPAGTYHTYQVIANRYSGSGYWDCFADGRFNYLECVVRPT